MNNEQQKHQDAWIVFSAQTDIAWLKILKPGFRHCTILLNDGERWITFDPLSNYTQITTHHVPPEFNLPLWMEDRGHTVVKSTMQNPLKPAPLGLFTCVESVKRVLGLHNRFIITPWQLYKHLTGYKATNKENNTHKKHDNYKGDLAWEV